jgi:hypothetical protein
MYPTVGKLGVTVIFDFNLWINDVEVLGIGNIETAMQIGELVGAMVKDVPKGLLWLATIRPKNQPETYEFQVSRLKSCYWSLSSISREDHWREKLGLGE